MSTQSKFIDQVAHAALLAALFVLLAFQELRFEGYETEKAGLLTIIGGLLLACHAVRWRTWSPQLLQNPVVIGVGLLFVWSMVSTLFSWSPSRSFWGAPDRPDSLLTRLVFVLLFFQAVRSGPRLFRDLIPAVTMIALTTSAFGLLLRVDDVYTERVASTAGNPNFLSAWLVMALVFLVTALLLRLHRDGLHFSVDVALMGGVSLLVLVTLLMASSRGALLGLALGGLTGVIIWAVFGQRRRVLLVTLGGVMVLSPIYTVVSVRVQSSDQASSGISRIFQPYDQFRVDAWNGATTIMDGWSQAHTNFRDEADSAAGLRPLVGFGLDTTAQTQGAFGVLPSERIYINSFHNQGFDALITTGIGGLVAWVLVYGGAIFLALRELGLLRADQWVNWAGVQIVGGVVGVGVMSLIIADASLSAVVPLGFTLGNVGALLLWIASRIQHMEEVTALIPRMIVIAGLMCVVIVRMVDNQFGFTQIASEPLWWVILGLLVAMRNSADDVQHESAGWAWMAATLAAGVMMIYSLGPTFDSQSIRHEAGTDQLPWVILTVFVIGLAGMRRQLIAMVPVILVAWGAYFGLEVAIGAVVGGAVDDQLAQTAPNLQGHMLLLSLRGVIAVVLGVIAWTVADGWHMKRPNTLATGVVVAGLCAGIVLYTTSFGGSMLHSMGNNLSRSGDLALIDRANHLYDDSAALAPYNTRNRIDWSFNLLKQVIAAEDGDLTTVDAQLSTLFDYEPYYHYSLAWSVFVAQYGPIAQNQ